MAIRRQKLDRDVDLTLDRGQVIDIAPGWTFIITCPYHGKISFDFNLFRRHGRDELAGQIRDAVWNLRHEMVGATLKFLVNNIHNFWRFLDTLHDNGIQIGHLNQINRKLLDSYLAWQELQVATAGKGKGRPLSYTGNKKRYNALKTILVNRQKRTPNDTSPELDFPRNPFPNSNQQAIKREP